MIFSKNKLNKNKYYPEGIEDFNWGAFLLTFIWGLKYNIFISIFTILFIVIHLPLNFNFILLVIFKIYCGTKGNKWAYDVKHCKNYINFKKVQLQWAICGAIINIFIPFIFLSIISEFLTTNPNNMKEYIENAQCTITYNKLKDGLPRITIDKNSNSEKIARKFGKQFNNAIIAGDTVLFSLNPTQKHKEAYRITFDKSDTEPCNLHKRNCKIEASYVIASEVFDMETCKYTFDNKKILPNKATQKAIEKGINIFNYL